MLEIHWPLTECRGVVSPDALAIWRCHTGLRPLYQKYPNPATIAPMSATPDCWDIPLTNRNSPMAIIRIGPIILGRSTFVDTDVMFAIEYVVFPMMTRLSETLTPFWS